MFKADPEYSEQARKANDQGTVVLHLVVQKDGAVRDIEILQPLGLDEKAIEAVAQWRFIPGMRNGEPVDRAAIIEVNFRSLQAGANSAARDEDGKSPFDEGRKRM